MNYILNVNFSGRRETTTSHLWKYDYGQVMMIYGLDLPEYFEAHFSNSATSGTTITKLGHRQGVEIPDELLLTGQTIYCWIYLHSDVNDGETEYKITIPVKNRPMPENTVTPEQQSAIEQAIDALNEVATDAEAWAVGQRHGVDVDSEDETYENNSKYWATLSRNSANEANQSAIDAKGSEDAAALSERNASDSASAAAVSESNAEGYKTAAANSAQMASDYADASSVSADRAEQAANSAGYMFFHVDEYGHLIYERTSGVDVDFSLSNGHLIMEA